MANEKSEQVVAALQRLGFSDYETRAYLALLRKSPATAYQVSKLGNIPRANTYAVLGKLLEKRAVIQRSEHPARFVPVSPDQLFTAIAAEIATHCAFLRDELVQEDSSDSTDVVWSIEGQDKIDAKIGKIIDEAKRHVWLKAHKPIVDRYVPKLRQACERGVSILVILFGASRDPFGFEGDALVLPHEGNGVRIGNADNYCTITADFNIALIANIAGSPVGTYTQNKPIVTMADTLIRHEVYMAEIFLRFGEQIDREFGPFLYKLRTRYFSPEQRAIFHHMFAKQTESLSD